MREGERERLHRGVIDMQPPSLVPYKGGNAGVDQLFYSILTQCFLASWFSEDTDMHFSG